MTNKNKSYVIEMYKTEESVNITTQEGNMFFSYDIPKEYLKDKNDVESLMFYIYDKDLNFKFIGEEEEKPNNIQHYTFEEVESTLKYYLNN
ncbi:hypothetical protein [Staphylococcus pseudintermedius]|uniref:hypothetical protein n=1 Tax=Staphylococcus pseudintermedius TaxID=283734 RepID=UPI002B26126D|nr:hypothetical protein [Staphylococcus pseudintermedius]WQM17804.1 hypothetical protein P3U68_07805 [Staphylococcus pseudintermedius]